MKPRHRRSSIQASPAPAEPAAAGAERSASAVPPEDPAGGLLPVTGLAPKFHRPVFAYAAADAEPVLARRTPDLGWIRHAGEARLGWEPVGFRWPA